MSSSSDVGRELELFAVRYWTSLPDPEPSFIGSDKRNGDEDDDDVSRTRSEPGTGFSGPGIEVTWSS